MTGIVPGFVPLANATPLVERYPTHRCRECTLMRCYYDDSRCLECDQHMTEGGNVYCTGDSVRGD
jgi:hypothetical protein